MADDVTEVLYGSYQFLLELESLRYGEREIVAGFSTISGGGVKIEKRDTTTGDDRHKTHMPGPVEYENLTLSRGITTNTDLLDWIRAILNGDSDRRSGSVILLDNAGEEVRRWNFYDSYPISWSGPDLASDGSNMAIEKFDLAIGWMEWQ